MTVIKFCLCVGVSQETVCRFNFEVFVYIWCSTVVSKGVFLIR